MPGGHSVAMKKKALSVSVGRRIRLLRERAKLSRMKLATDIEVAPYTLTKIELGLSDPKIGTLDKIARALRLPLSGLLEDEAVEDRGRSHRRALNNLMRVLQSQDEKTLEALADLVRSGLVLKKSSR